MMAGPVSKGKQMNIIALVQRNTVPQVALPETDDAAKIKAGLKERPQGFTITDLGKQHRAAVREVVGQGYTVTSRVGGGLSVKRIKQ